MGDLIFSSSAVNDVGGSETISSAWISRRQAFNRSQAIAVVKRGLANRSMRF